MFRRTLKTAVRILREKGPAGLYDAIRRKIYFKVIAVQWRLDLADWKPRIGNPPKLAVRRGSLEEISCFRNAWTGPPLPFEFSADRIYGVQWFYLGIWEGQIAHITWVFTQADRGANIKLGPGEVEIRLAHTLRMYRGHGILTSVLNAIVADLKREGVRTAFGHVREGNMPALRVFTRVGFRPIRMVTFRWLLGVPLMPSQPRDFCLPDSG